MPDFRLSGRARRDLVEIYQYTAQRYGAAQAEVYLQILKSGLRLIADNPRLGRNVHEIRAGMFRADFGRHIIFYREIANDILVIRILHQSMDFDRHL